MASSPQRSLLGQAAGKPKNASELGRYVGIPRVTAQRKLDDLEKGGIVVRRGNKYHIGADLKKAVNGELSTILAVAPKFITIKCNN